LNETSFGIGTIVVNHFLFLLNQINNFILDNLQLEINH